MTTVIGKRSRHAIATRTAGNSRLGRVGSKLLAVAAVVGVGLTMAGPAYAVANGEPVSEGTYRFAVKLTMPDITRPDGTHYSSGCSASLIAPQWIVSAGHCFHDGARNPISGPVRYPVIATVGTTDVNSGKGVTVNVVEVQQAPSTDLAVGKLATPVNGITPLQLNNAAVKVNTKVRIAGWGWTGQAGTTPAPSPKLYTGQFKVSSVTSTTIGVKGYSPQATTSACAYDSGAPYFIKKDNAFTLVSVESTGPDCPHNQEETTSRVDNIRSWILGVIG